MTFALEISNRTDLGVCGGDQLHLARRPAELDDRFGVFAECLQIDVVVVEADHALDGAGEHFVGRFDARRLAEQRDVEALLVEVAELLG